MRRVFLLSDIINTDICKIPESDMPVIQNVKILKDQMQLIFYLESFKTYDYLLVQEQLEKKFPEFGIEIKAELIDRANHKASNLLENIKYEIFENFPNIWWLKKSHLKIERHNLIIDTDVDCELDIILESSIYSDLEKKIKNNYGLEVLINNLGEGNLKSFITSKVEKQDSMAQIIAKESLANNIGSKVILGKKINFEPLKIDEILNIEGIATIQGEIYDSEIIKLKNEFCKLILYMTDYSNSIPVVYFGSESDCNKIKTSTTEFVLLVNGEVKYDVYMQENTIIARSISIHEAKNSRQDSSSEKRIELHCHTNMSSLDGISNVKDIIEKAKSWGHTAIAITDHGVVQAFPDAMNCLDKDDDFKVIYGLEANMINDDIEAVDIELDSQMPFVIFDIETTGLSAKYDRITEIGAVKMINGKIIDEFSSLVNPEMPIPYEVVKLTGITDQMVINQPNISEVLPKFLEFIGNDGILVAHNADFDISFIKAAAKDLNYRFDPVVIDTLKLARAVFSDLKTFRLGFLCKHVGIDLKNAHRAIHDAIATAQLFNVMIERLKEEDYLTISQVFKEKIAGQLKERENHVVLLAKDHNGLKNLYRLVSLSHTKYFDRKPKLPKSIIEKFREGLLIGSACNSGELYQAILSQKDEEEIKTLMGFYDYIEIQPVENNKRIIFEGLLKDENDLIHINKTLARLAEEQNKIVVATGDVHYLEKSQIIYRTILKSYRNTVELAEEPHLHFRTTEEMLDEFSYFGKDKAFTYVVENTKKISDLIDYIRPIPEGTFTPSMDGAIEELKDITLNKAYRMYGQPLPELVQTRVSRELEAIISNGYAVLYMIAQKLVSRSNEDGYLVGSRGSVGSSLVATLTGITEVNPLPPHYYCKKCQYTEFFQDNSFASGYDLPEKACPKCGKVLIKEGHDIPFEVFLGFDGDKEPDIDLNFASEYQSKAHRYTEEIFGEGYVFRAGTITKIAEKVARGFVLKYLESNNIQCSNTELNRLAKGCEGVKRSTGQHPGGIMVVPRDKDIYDFTPIQYPADDVNTGVITTHFDFEAISSTILKLDLLGHDVPTIIKMLEDYSNQDALNIPMDDSKVLSLFRNSDTLDLDPVITKINTGTLGIPEFGTGFVRQMLIETQPTKFSDLIRISGLSHGTNVWTNNAQELIKEGRANISNVISTREDVMDKLINSGLDKKQAFHIMERVRKGKGLAENEVKEINALEIDDWFIDSANKISYLFPKAHAVAYVMMSYRIAYFKLYYPLSFYAATFTIKVDDFDGHNILLGPAHIKSQIKQIRAEGKITDRDFKILDIYEIALEMYARGFSFINVDIYESSSNKFAIRDGKLLPPLRALQGVPENAAISIANEREKGTFNSVEDLIERTKITKVAVNALKEHGCLEFLPEKNQLSFFNF